MNIRGLMLVKDEADIIEYTIRASAGWCDAIYVYDNGSTDGTWEIVRELSKSDDRVILFAREEKPFDDSLRGVVFNHFCSQATRGDWWVRFDADEVYIDDPRKFLQSIPPSHHVVWSLHYQYFLVPDDVSQSSFNVIGNPAPKVEYDLLPRHFRVNGSEARFFRHRDRLRWPSGATWPWRMGLVTPARIRLRHYKYRSPAQIARRLSNRQQARSEGHPHFTYDVVDNWRDKLANPDDLLCEDSFESLHDAPIDDSTPNHLEPTSKRLIKRVMHGIGLWP